MSSLLSLHVKRLGEVLRFGAEEQVDESKTELESASDLYDDFVSELIVTEFDYARAYDVANRLFGSTSVKFAAVDGSQDQRLVSGLAVFWEVLTLRPERLSSRRMNRQAWSMQVALSSAVTGFQAAFQSMLIVSLRLTR